MSGVTTRSIDYLQRVDMEPAASTADTTYTEADPASRRLLGVQGIGRYTKQLPPPATLSEWRLPTRDLLTGLHGHRLPLTFAVSATGESVHIALGTWSAATAAPDDMDARRDLLAALLRGAYPAVMSEPVSPMTPPWERGGLAVGVPNIRPPERGDDAAPLDRVIRAMQGNLWSAVVLAYPVAESAIGGMRDEVLNEIRLAETTADRQGGSAPLVEHYVSLLEAALASLHGAGVGGAWRTAVYLLGDVASYPKLSSQWRGVFAGHESLASPVRVFDRPEAPELAAKWSMPDTPGVPGPSGYRHQLECQTILTSDQLAAYVHLPEIETPGFAIDLVPRFDSVTADRLTDGGDEPEGTTGITLGHVVHETRPTSARYSVTPRSLTRHALVAGLTGSGKTNTITAMLEEVDAADVPFLVVEPTKTEYRRLLNHPRIGGRLQVLTAGTEAVSPLRLNPFEVPDGIAVGEHLDLLRATFGASFGMWTPLPEVLEHCLHEVYQAKGWDLRNDRNHRLDPGSRSDAAFPTLSDLIATVDDVVPRLGYHERVTDDVRAALTTRLGSLRAGAKGAMLDVSSSIPIEELLDRPTVLELETMGDDSDKAFLMGLLVIRLAEHRRVQGPSDELVHLLVVEEAHRLLADVEESGSELTGNAQHHAVETFANLLSEIRASGQGVVAADQIPVRLAPAVIKNTNLKLAHRTVAADDRAVLASAMAMTDEQSIGIAVLEVGRAAVFSEGDDAPLLVQVPLVVDALGALPSDEEIAAHMAGWREERGLETVLLPRPMCATTCAGAARACEVARRLITDDQVRRALGRTVLSFADHPSALARRWGDVMSVVAARLPRDVAPDEVAVPLAAHGAEWYASRRGDQSGWSYSATETFAVALGDALVDHAAGTGDASSTTEFQRLFQDLHARTYEPYPGCASVCDQEPPMCRYRSAVADLVATGRYRRVWLDADADDAASGERSRSWQVAQDAGFELIEFPGEVANGDAEQLEVRNSARRASLCFAQQMLAADQRKVPATMRRGVDQLLRQAGIASPAGAATSTQDDDVSASR